MERERTVTTRELLRNFRALKDELLSGSLHVISISVGRGNRLHLTPVRSGTTASALARRARALRRPIRVGRTHLFDVLLRRR